MGEWHRENPDLIGTEADPWMIHASYRRMYVGLADDELNRLDDERRDAAREVSEREESQHENDGGHA